VGTYVHLQPSILALTYYLCGMKGKWWVIGIHSQRITSEIRVVKQHLGVSSKQKFYVSFITG